MAGRDGERESESERERQRVILLQVLLSPIGCLMAEETSVSISMQGISPPVA